MNEERRAYDESRNCAYREPQPCQPHSLPVVLSRETEERLKKLAFAQDPQLRKAFEQIP